MGDEYSYACDKLRTFLFERVYNDSEPKKEEYKAIQMLKMLYEYFIMDISRLPEGYATLDTTDSQKVCDYIANMTDSYSIFIFNKIFVPKGWQY